jgi:hypothetical protein
MTGGATWWKASWVFERFRWRRIETARAAAFADFAEDGQAINHFP